MKRKIDLITGLLGAGKTTFIASCAKRLAGRGEHICILANDYGAISVDRAFLLEELGDSCDIEMVVAGDADCQRRRFRTKLISFAMLGYDRVLVEPSGVFDVEEFYNILYDDPISGWYETGNVISVISADLPDHLTEGSEYMLTNQAATAGLIVVSKADLLPAGTDEAAVEERIRAHLVRNAGTYHCSRDFSKAPMLFSRGKQMSDEDWDSVEHAGRVPADMVHMTFQESGQFGSLFYFHISRRKAEMEKLAETLLTDPERFGHVVRVKGFFTDPSTGQWMELNAVRGNVSASPSPEEPSRQEEVIILVGEGMKEKEIGALLGETRSVTDYSI